MHVVVITPVGSGSFLPALAASFHDAVAGLPEQVQLCWSVALDGVDVDCDQVRDLVRPLLPARVQMVTSAAYRQRGPAYTRNVALFTAVESGAVDVVASIDADDFWLPGGLTRLVAPFACGAAWVAAANVWVDVHGGVYDVYRPVDGLTGPVPPGAVRAAWDAGGVFPFAASCAAYRANVLTSRGGWPASPSGEDAVLMLGVSDVHSGFALTDPVFAYRSHPAQATASVEHARLRALTGFMMSRLGH